LKSDSDRLWDELCCCGEDHTIREGGSHINLVMVRKLAKWPYLAQFNVLVPESKNYPLATAVVCDRCLDEKREIKYVIGGRDSGNGHVEYFRVPMGELEIPAVYWPDLHPYNKPLFAS